MVVTNKDGYINMTTQWGSHGFSMGNSWDPLGGIARLLAERWGCFLCQEKKEVINNIK